MRPKLIILLLALFSFELFAQDSLHKESEKIQLLKSQNSDFQTKNYLQLRKAMINLILHPYIKSEIIDTLKVITRGKIDSTNFTEFKVSDSTQIFLRNSYFWTIGEPLPKKHKLSNLKYIFRNTDKYSAEDIRLLNYLKFNAEPNDSLVDKFIHFQNYRYEENKLIQIVYDIKLTMPREVKLLDVTIIKDYNE
nr:hypothetical protein [uncultured Carboxylicivirga sp.]